MIIRPATGPDLAAVAEVLEVSDESAAWPGLPGWPYLEHLLARARVPIAIAGDGVVVGMAGSIEVGTPEVRFLTDLFVRPDQQDHGAGRALLDAAFEGAHERLTFSSADPRALALYLRAGLRPWWPVLYLALARGVLEQSPDPGLAIEGTDPATAAGWSAAWTGMDRTIDFAHYAALPGGSGSLVRVDGAVGAVVWSNRGRNDAWRVLDHVTMAPGVDPVAVALTAIRSAFQDAPGLVVTVPGPHPVVPWLLERGARITDRDQFCSTDPDLLDLERILPSPGFL